MTEIRATRIEVVAEKPDWLAALPDIAPMIEQAARAVLAAEGRAGEVAVLLSDDRHIRALNAQFLGTDAATNVLSFPAGDGEMAPDPQSGEFPPLGDIILAFETVAREAGAQSISLAAHVSHLVVHGMLHILGYDHQNDMDCKIMTDREIDILAGLGWPDPYVSHRDKITGSMRHG